MEAEIARLVNSDPRARSKQKEMKKDSKLQKKIWIENIFKEMRLSNMLMNISEKINNSKYNMPLNGETKGKQAVEMKRSNERVIFILKSKKIFWFYSKKYNRRRLLTESDVCKVGFEQTPWIYLQLQVVDVLLFLMNSWMHTKLVFGRDRLRKVLVGWKIPIKYS
jgi:hypothetical protein